MRAFAIFALICLSQYTRFSVAASDDPSNISKLSHSVQWLRLLHQGQSDRGGNFYFSPVGRQDPEAELRASIRAMSEGGAVGKLKQHPQCAFPFRYRFLKKELSLQILDVPCPQFQAFLDRVKADSVTLVFSSAYPNNPGSMFGHTFLRINSHRKAGEKKLDLLDYGISYAASVGQDDGGVTFALLGIFGGYYGAFSLVPYYLKVNEYNHAESRDVWEYDLSLTRQETFDLIAHAWELENNSAAKYYFIDENCSYVLLTLIEAVKPEWDLSRFGTHVVPSETVKRLTQIPGAVTAVHFRPSLRKNMQVRFQNLSSSQKAELHQLIEGKIPAEKLSDVQVIEAASSYFYYLKQKNGKSTSDETRKILQALLFRRSQLGHAAPDTGTADGSKKTETSQDLGATLMKDRFYGGSRPDLAHPPYRLGTATGTQNTKWFQELQFKFAFHDLMNNDAGYIPFSHIDFPHATLRYGYSTHQLRLENLTAAAVTSLFPMSTLEKSFSWRARVDYYTPRDLGCDGCHLGRTQAGGGIAVETFSHFALFYTMAVAQLELGQGLGHGFRLGPRWEAAWIWNPWQPYKFRVEWATQADLFQSRRQKISHQLDVEQSYSLSSRWELRALASWILPTWASTLWDRESKLTLNHYF